MQLKNFPEDGRLWVVKWIDKFTLPHLRTRSASVEVLWQRLDHDDPRTLHRLKADEIRGILGTKVTGPSIWNLSRHLAGYIPYLSIGLVFQNGRLVGELPPARDHISLSDPEAAEHHLLVADDAAVPPGWDLTKFPYYRILNTFEFSGLPRHGFGNSRCVIHEVGDTQYIIPRSVIFRSFYGLNSAIANAFCKGPWHETSHDVICYSVLESGLVTRPNQEDGAWDIILQPKTDTKYAQLLAAYTFDPYAKACAASIYTNALRDRGTSMQNPWFASAKIPFDPTLQAIHLTIKGYRLNNFSTARKKFLVTGIVESSFPQYFPQIRYEKAHSGAQGLEITEVNEPAPFQSASNTEPAPSDVVATSEEDINIAEGGFMIPSDDLSWPDAPPLIKLTKPKSKRYQNYPKDPSANSDNETVSAGTPTHQLGGGAEAQIEISINRDRSRQFALLLEAFDDLVKSKILDGYAVFGPAHASPRATRGSLPCWTFLNDEERESGKWPRRGWRLLEQAPATRKGVKGILRCALVVELVVNGNRGYWIEIEVRPGSGEGYRSPYIVTAEDPTEVIAHFLMAIAELNGVRLLKELPKEASMLGGTTVHCYKHQYRARDSAELNRTSIASFLRR
jgi:hypothetical protein